MKVCNVSHSNLSSNESIVCFGGYIELRSVDILIMKYPWFAIIYNEFLTRKRNFVSLSYYSEFWIENIFVHVSLCDSTFMNHMNCRCMELYFLDHSSLHEMTRTVPIPKLEHLFSMLRPQELHVATTTPFLQTFLFQYLSSNQSTDILPENWRNP